MYTLFIYLTNENHKLAIAVVSFITWNLLYVEPGQYFGRGIPPRYVTKITRSTQPCIHPGSLTRVPALVALDKGGNVTSSGWQGTLCDPMWYKSSHSDEACSRTDILGLICITLHTRSSHLSVLMWSQRWWIGIARHGDGWQLKLPAKHCS